MIDRITFLSLIGEQLIDFNIALENDNVIDAVKAGDVDQLKTILLNEF